MTYWLERNLHLKNRIWEYKVYRQAPGGPVWFGKDKDYAEWWQTQSWRTTGLFSAELEDGLTPQQAAEEMRKLAGWR